MAADVPMTTSGRDAVGAEIRLSTGMAVRVREAHEDVLARLSAAPRSGATGILTLTREDGTPVHILTGHVVLIEPQRTAEPGTEPPQTA